MRHIAGQDEENAVLGVLESGGGGGGGDDGSGSRKRMFLHHVKEINLITRGRKREGERKQKKKFKKNKKRKLRRKQNLYLCRRQ